MRRIGLGIICLFLFSFVKAQSNQDFGSWLGLSAGYKVSKKIKINGVTQVRTFENSQALKQVFLDLGVAYKYNKHLKFGLAWRGKENYANINPVYSNRVGFDVRLSQKIIKKTHLSFRSRTQYSFVENNLNKPYERLRLKLTYKVKKGLTVFVQDELFFNLNAFKNSAYDKNRFGIGASKKINKKLELTSKYLRIKEIGVYRPLTMNVLFASINYKI